MFLPIAVAKTRTYLGKRPLDGCRCPQYLSAEWMQYVINVPFRCRTLAGTSRVPIGFIGRVRGWLNESDFAGCGVERVTTAELLK